MSQPYPWAAFLLLLRLLYWQQQAILSTHISIFTIYLSIIVSIAWAVYFYVPYSTYIPKRLRNWKPGVQRFIELFIGHRNHTRYKQGFNINSVWIKLAGLLILSGPTLFACDTAADTTPDHLFKPFDSDSYAIRVDNCCSKCITNRLEDFETPPQQVFSTTVKGIGGRIHCTHKGTIVWNIEDDQGRIHKLRIPGSFYTREAPSRLLSPQHWAQTANDNKPQRHGTWCATYDDSIVLEWRQRQYRRTIKLDPGTNVATIYTAPGYRRANIVCNAMVRDHHAYPTLIPDDEPDGRNDTAD